MVEPLESSVLSVVQLAKRFNGATVSMKDSLLSVNRMKEIGACINGSVRWSACTKLSQRFDFETLRRLSSQGLSTLEVGLESLLPETQQKIFKIQDRSLFKDMLVHTAGIPGLSLVVNYMTGFAWEDSREAELVRLEAEEWLRLHLGSRGMMEQNTFELERLSQMARHPEKFGMEASNLRLWPWASIVEQRT